MENAKLKIPIYMYHLLNSQWEEQIMSQADCYPFQGSNFLYDYFGPRAQWLLSVALSSLDLSRQDEIVILTTSDEVYVSICVSIPAFNYSRISRVVSDITKVIIVIHEFGFIYSDIESRVQEWHTRGIIVIEDCAHVIGKDISGKSIGSFGDFALFSLTKVIPGRAGGLLRTNMRLKLPSMDQYLSDLTEVGKLAAGRYLSKYKFFNNRRLQIYNLFKLGLPESLFFEPSTVSVPFFIGIISYYKKEICTNNDWVEWGPTLRNDLLYIPSNPLSSDEDYSRIIREVWKSEKC